MKNQETPKREDVGTKLKQTFYFQLVNDRPI